MSRRYMAVASGPGRNKLARPIISMSRAPLRPRTSLTLASMRVRSVLALQRYAQGRQVLWRLFEEGTTLRFKSRVFQFEAYSGIEEVVAH